ncbi:hypothetical protein EPN28_01215 [Patescibacteria group bacterium]|nr:MAG: hypothetical protein EPN28_01215 [Patescibacteria group bacterium]
MFKRLSLHPKLVAVVDTLITLAMLWWLNGMSSKIVLALWFVFRLAIWAGFIKLMYFSAGASRARHFLSLLIFCAGLLTFILFTEWTPARLLFEAIFALFPFFGFWLLPASEAGLPTFLKPHSRLSFMMCIIGLAGIFALVSAISSFQLLTSVSAWVWIVLASLVATAVAGWWWFEYGLKVDDKFISRLAIWFVMFLEFLWVILILPFGYMVNGLLTIWCWYILWLLMRFNMTEEGIKWRKQALFLVSNVVLFVGYLLLAVKWK